MPFSDCGNRHPPRYLNPHLVKGSRCLEGPNVGPVAQLRLDVGAEDLKGGRERQPFLPLLSRSLVMKRGDDHGHVDVGRQHFVYRRVRPLDLLHRVERDPRRGPRGTWGRSRYSRMLGSRWTVTAAECTSQENNRSGCGDAIKLP